MVSKRIGILVGLAVTVALAISAPALAKGREVRVAGACTQASTSKLKLSEENGRIEVEFEVDQNRVGVRWAVVLRANGRLVGRATRVTGARSGSFEARFLAANGAGVDRFAALATNRSSGESCRARASF